MPTARRERLWLVGGALIAFFIMLIGYFFFISPQNGQTSDANAQVSNARNDNATLQRRITLLAQQNKNLARYQQQLQQARLALPDSSGLPDFLRSLQSMGDATLASVTSLSVGAPTQLAGATKTTTPTSTGSATPATKSPKVTTGTKSGTVYALPVTAIVTGSAAQLDQFLTMLQSVQPRAVLITQLVEGGGGTTGTTGGTASGRLTLTLTMQAFVAPSSAAELAKLSAASGR
jgi:hypothetical protein